MTDDPKQQTPAEGLDALFAKWNRMDEPGLVVGVAHRGAVIYRRGFGMASLESGLVNTPKTRMRIGSTTKHFTCLAALLLAEEGKLDIDAGIRTYIPELPAFDPDPTLRQLMNHTGGLRCFIDLAMYSSGISAIPDGGALDFMVRQHDRNFAPGDEMIYCNGGYFLLSLAIERVSGLSFEAFLKERIFLPLGMTDTVAHSSDLELLSGMATLHNAAADGSFTRGIFPVRIKGEGSIVSTIDDMLGWIRHLRAADHRVGGAETWRQMLTRPRYNSGTESNYCLGLSREFYRGIETIHHAGGVMGGQSQMLTVPDHELDIIIMANRSGTDPSGLALKIIDILLADALDPLSAKVEGTVGEAVAGRYHGARSHLLYGLSVTDGKLGFSLSNSPAMPLTAGADGAFALSIPGMGDFVIRANDPVEGKSRSIVVDYCGRQEAAERLPDEPPETAAAADGFVGRYDGPDQGAGATVTLVDGHLRLALQGQYGRTVYKLMPVSRDVFAGMADDPLLPLPLSITAHRTGGQVDLFWIDTGRTRHLQFTRL
ncbi:MAG TPA: serine hydrolase domain-containing protein [Aliidongia sp.]|uniref:serine hydrolase domain-containing protein n=1 Tax=Aliidongia sp. TaxID=1914230 RepID=UPI002DDD463C|nr:serine hydrolase domain-containing protein [Aliidongia sp.]HEV2676068.1 serine hydrolase domain-containing protein [Aliidongia sp.]